MAGIEKFAIRVEKELKTLSPDEAARYWSPEEVAKREANATTARK